MAWRSLPLSDELIWRAPLPTAEHALAESIREKIATLRPHLLDFLRLDEPAPRHALTLAEWSQPIALRSLLATWSDHIYRHQADAASGTEASALALGAMVYRSAGAAADAGAAQ